jgi:hypothetical protein
MIAQNILQGTLLLKEVDLLNQQKKEHCLKKKPETSQIIQGTPLKKVSKKIEQSINIPEEEEQ